MNRMHSEIVVPEPVVRAPVAITAIARPFSTEPQRVELPEGGTLADILAAVQPDPVLRRFAHVYVGDDYICPTYYHHVRPKAGAEVSIRIVPGQSGGGGGRKNPIATVLMVAVVIVATIFGQYYVAPMLGGGLLGSVGGAIATAAIATAGPMVVSGAFPARLRS